ncbi:MAG: septum site-determining protein MinD [Firmicutes bacterium]|nr:septum site-determining protein MinD [Bacillota bacterium]
MSKVLLVSSGKGGTGKTMVSVNLGATLAQSGFKVLIVDMDMGLRNVDVYLGMENKVVYNLMDVMSGICRINQAVLKVGGFRNLYFIAASPIKDERDITDLHMQVLCNKLGDVFDFIIIDTPAGIGEMVDIAAAVSESAIIVTEPDSAALRDADSAERYIRNLGIRDIKFVINKVNLELMKQGFLPSIEEIVNMFGSSIIGWIPEDDNIRISTSKGIPIVAKRGTYLESAFLEIGKKAISRL